MRFYHSQKDTWVNGNCQPQHLGWRWSGNDRLKVTLQFYNHNLSPSLSFYIVQWRMTGCSLLVKNLLEINFPAVMTSSMLQACKYTWSRSSMVPEDGKRRVEMQMIKSLKSKILFVFLHSKNYFRITTSMQCVTVRLVYVKNAFESHSRVA